MYTTTRWHGRAPSGPPARRCHGQGQSLVELSLALPLMLLLMLGTLDLGRVFFDYVQIRNAVREGAGYGARNPTDAAGIAARVTAHGVPSGTTVTSNCSGACTTPDSTATITVTASRTFTPITTAFLQTYFGVAPFAMSATASMRVMT